MTRPSWLSRTPSRAPLDMTRINRAADLLAQGATEQVGPAGLVQLCLGGRVEMTTGKAVVKEARQIQAGLGVGL